MKKNDKVGKYYWLRNGWILVTLQIQEERLNYSNKALSLVAWKNDGINQEKNSIKGFEMTK